MSKITAETELRVRQVRRADGFRTGSGWSLGFDRASFTQAATPSSGGTAAGSRSQGARGDSLRLTQRHSLGDAAPGNGLWEWDDLLATTSRLAEEKGLGETPSDLASGASGGRPNRFLPSRSRQQFDPGGGGGEKTGPSPVDRRKAGSKHHLLTDAQGVPVVVKLTGANRHDVTQLLPLTNSVPPMAGQVGRPLQRPQRMYADRAYDSQPHRDQLRGLGIEPHLARRRTEHGSGLGKYRRVVERTISWLHQFRRLRVRYDRRADIHEAFLTLGCVMICWNLLDTGFC